MPKKRKTGSRPSQRLPREQALAFELRVTVEVIRRSMQRQLDDFGVRFAQWSYLRVLWERDGLSQNELSNAVRRVGANTVSALNALEKAGLVRRVRSKTDRRNTHVFLTATGRALEKDLMPLAEGTHARAVTGISEAELETFKHVLKTIRTNLGSY